MKLNIACGPVYLDGWINSDLRPSDMPNDEVSKSWKLDEVWDMTKRLPLEDNSVDFILAWHCLEHASLGDSGEMVRDWHRVLRPGGMVACAVPDVIKVAKRWEIGEFDDFIGAVNIAGPYNGYDGDFHRWAYCQRSLENKFREAGFPDVRELRSHGQAGELLEKQSQIGFADYNAQILAIK